METQTNKQELIDILDKRLLEHIEQGKLLSLEEWTNKTSGAPPLEINEARLAIEAYYVHFQTYTGATEVILESDYGYQPSFGVALAITPPPTNAEYTLTVCAIGGTSPAFSYTSSGGTMTPSPGPCT